MRKNLLLLGIFGACSLFGADFFINDVKVTSNFAETDTEWMYAQKIDLTSTNFPAEFKIPATAIRRHPRSKHVAGYNGNLIVKVKAPTQIKSFDIKGKITNFPDKIEREAAFSYSLDGINYTTVEKKKFGGKNPSSVTVGGKIDLPANYGVIFLKFERFYKKGDRNGQYGNILWNVFDLNFFGSTADKSTVNFAINNKTPEIGYSQNNSDWQFERIYNLVSDAIAPELGITDKHIRKHPTSKHIKGYNGNIILAVNAPGTVKSLDCKGSITNFPDTKERFASLSYSLDGKKYTEIVKKPFGGKHGARLTLNGKINLPDNDGKIFIKFERHYLTGDRNGQYGNILWQNFHIKLNGSTTVAEGKAPEVDEAAK